MRKKERVRLGERERVVTVSSYFKGAWSGVPRGFEPATPSQGWVIRAAPLGEKRGEEEITRMERSILPDHC